MRGPRLAGGARRPAAVAALCAVLMALTGAAYVSPRLAQAAAVDPNCPAGWTCENLGPTTGGETLNADGSWTVTGSGSGIHNGGSPDYLHMLSQPHTGDAQMVAQVVSQGTALIKPQAGILMRASDDVRAPFFGLIMFANDPSEKETQPKIVVFARSTQGGTIIEYTKVYPAPQPIWLMAQRHGNSFTASTSHDGVHWTLIPGTQHTLALPATLLDGVYVSSENSTDVETATFAHVAAGAATAQPVLPPSKHGCPSGWSCQDIDDTAPVGDQILSGGTWTITGTGKAIGGREDSFNFVDQVLHGDGAITAHLTSVGAAAPTSAAGLMVRAALDPWCPYFAIVATAAQGTTVSWRSTQGGTSVTGATLGTSAPLWLRITRTTVGTQVTYSAWTSGDGVAWTVVNGSAVTLNLGSTGTLAGMAADAVKPGGTNPAVYSSVTIG